VSLPNVVPEFFTSAILILAVSGAKVHRNEPFAPYNWPKFVGREWSQTFSSFVVVTTTENGPAGAGTAIMRISFFTS